MISYFKQRLGTGGNGDGSSSSSSDKPASTTLTRKTSSSSVSSSSNSTPNKRASFSQVEVVIPIKRSVSTSNVAIKSNKGSPSTSSARNGTPSTTHVQMNGSSSKKSRLSTPSGSKVTYRNESPELYVPASPPKRARLDEGGQRSKSTSTSSKPVSISTISPKSITSSSSLQSPRKSLPAASTSTSTSAFHSTNGPSKPLAAKRKRALDDTHEEEDLSSDEFKGAPVAKKSKIVEDRVSPNRNASFRDKASMITSSPASKEVNIPAIKISPPRKEKKGIPNANADKPQITKSRPSSSKPTISSPRPSSSKAQIIFLDDSDTEDESHIMERSVSLELPEILPTISPRKLALNAADAKGKGRASLQNEEEGNTSTTAATTKASSPLKVTRIRGMPHEASFHSLEELADFRPDIRPTYALWVLVRCAILGSGIEKLTLDGIISRIGEKYAYYRILATKAEERNKWSTAIKQVVHSKNCFQTEKDEKGVIWYKVDKKINPLDKRPSTKKKVSTPPAKSIKSATLGSTLLPLILRDNAIAAASASMVASSSTSQAGSSLSQDTSMQPVQSTQPLPQLEPKITWTVPPKLPEAELDIFATSLLHLQNAPPIVIVPPALASIGITTVSPALASIGIAPATLASGGNVPSKSAVIPPITSRIPYDLHVPIRAAILGSPWRRLKISAIMEDIKWKYPQLSLPAEPFADMKLKRMVTRLLHKHQCFFNIRPNTNANAAKLWMVDTSIDPRDVKVKPIKGIKQRSLTELGISPETINALLAEQPPSAMIAVPGKPTPEQLFRYGVLDGMSLESIETDLEEVKTFYAQRAEKWNRRMAYVHGTEVATITYHPRPAGAVELPVVEFPPNFIAPKKAKTPSRTGSPEVEEIISSKKAAQSNGSLNGVNSNANGTGKANGHTLHVSSKLGADTDDSTSSDEQMPSSTKSKTHSTNHADHEDSDASRSKDESAQAAQGAAAASASYVCGYQDHRTGAMCETRLPTREERETHQRFVHGVKNSGTLKAKMLQEAQLKLKKHQEQERINKKLQGQKGKKKVDAADVGKTSLDRKKVNLQNFLAQRNGRS